MSARNTMRELAKITDLGVGTVSRALSGSPLVKEHTRERVLSAAKVMGYTPNAVARSMRTRTSMTVGFLVPDIANPMLATIARAAQFTLQSFGYTLLLATSDGELTREREHVQQLAQRQIDGLLISTHHERARPLLDDLLRLNRPVVAIDRELDIPCDMVTADHASGIREIVTYLLSMNHRRIGLITASEEISPGRARARGYRTAFAEQGIAVDESLVCTGGLSEAFGLEATQKLLSQSTRPTAIIAGGNQILVGVMRALKIARLKFPDDVSLVSCDDTPLTELSSPGITTVVRDLTLMGQVSAELLIRRMRPENDSEPIKRIFPTSINLRGSCALVK